MTTRDDLLVAAGPSVDPGRWLGIFDELMTRLGSRFRRAEPRRRARAFALGLLAELPRVNCWTVAEHARDSSPDGMQLPAITQLQGIKPRELAQLGWHLLLPERLGTID